MLYIDSETYREKRKSLRFNAVGRQLTERLIPTSDNTNPVAHLLASGNDQIENALHDIDDSDMVGMTIQILVNQNDKPIRINFRRKDQLSAEVLWIEIEKFSLSNSRFNALNTLVVSVDSVWMPVVFGKHTITSRSRTLSVLAHLKKIIMEVKAEENCLPHAWLITISKVDKDPNYKAYIHGRKIRPVVQNRLKTTCIVLSNGAGIPEIFRFQEHLREYKIVVYRGLSCDDIFEG